MQEREGKLYARRLWVFLGPKEYGSDLMKRVAMEHFRKEENLDVVEVHEHGGWYLAYLCDGTIVGTANDTAQLDPKAISFLRNIYGYDDVTTIRRD